MPSQRHPCRRVAAVDQRRDTALATLGNSLFTNEQATRAGLTRSDLRSDAVIPVIRGVYAPHGWKITHLVRCVAALMVAPEGSCIGGHDAAALLGLPSQPRDRVNVTVQHRGRTLTRDCTRQRRTRHVVHVRGVPPFERLPVTAPHHLLAEALPLSTFVDAVVLADAVEALLRGKVRQQRPGDRAVSTVWDEVMSASRAGAESAMETRVRLLLHLTGLPEPVLQYEVVVDGQRYRLDLAYPDLKIAIEYDGGHHFDSDMQRHADQLRREALRSDGWHIVTVVSRGIYHDPAGTLHRVSAAFAAGGRIVHIHDGWRAHFTQRIRQAA